MAKKRIYQLEQLRSWSYQHPSRPLLVNLLTTLADRDPQGTTRIRATCDLSLLASSKASPLIASR